jgi:PAS domain S-box-containing protein
MNTGALSAVSFEEVPFQGIVEQSLAGIYVVQDERFVYANETFATMFGYQKEEFIGRKMVDCVTPDSAAEVLENYLLRITGKVPAIHYFTKGVQKDGAIVHLELHASRVICKGRPALAGVALDVTERVQAQEELRKSREQLRELVRHLDTAREAERLRLSREVHDVLGGMLTSAKFDLSRIVRRTRSDELSEVNNIASGLLELMQETIDTARTISEDLRPAGLDLLGLGQTLHMLITRFGERHGLTTTIEGAEAAAQVPQGPTLQIFRIVQEGLTNVAKHSGASAVDLRMMVEKGTFHLSLRDNGNGLGSGSRRPGAIGLLSMKERALEVGGNLLVNSCADGGALVVLTVPLLSGAIEVDAT